MKAVFVCAVTLIGAAGTSALVHARQDMNQFLPHAKPGECYARVVVPAEYQSQSSTVVVREATEKLNIVPAQYDWVDEKVLVREASIKYEVVPASYRTEKEEIELSPASTVWVSGSVYSSVAPNPGLLSLAEAGGVPVNTASPGQCFVEYYSEPAFEQVTERVLVSQASEVIKIVPARYEWVEQKEVVAAATHKMIEVPALYETKKERIKVEDARVEWKKGRGPIEKIDHSTGDVMCLIEVPAVYKTVEKTVMKSPPTSKLVAVAEKFETVRVRRLVEKAREVRTEIPARYREITKRRKVADGVHFWQEDNSDNTVEGRLTGSKLCRKEIPARTTTITRTVVDTQASVTPIEVPAQYQTKRVQRLLAEAVETRTVVPAVTKEVTAQVKVSDARLEWHPVLCETNVTNQTIRKLQSALNAAGFEAGAVNGELSESTMSSVRHFQSANGMATGELTIEVLRKLGVDPG